MKYLKKYNENFYLIKEDILQIKQLSKQIFSLLKKKGFNVKITSIENYRNTVAKSNKHLEGGNPWEVEIAVSEKNEVVIVAIPTDAAMAALIGNKERGWYDEATKKYGSSLKWFQSQPIRDYLSKLGPELTNMMKEQYPGLGFSFDTDGDWYYRMKFGFQQTKKGADVNPNQRPNDKNPQNITEEPK